MHKISNLELKNGKKNLINIFMMIVFSVLG